MIPVETALQRIAAHTPVPATAPGVRAVVAIAVETSTEPAEFIVTLRTSQLRTHAAQYALPGGRVDPGETLEEALLRELDEEIGDRNWRIVGRLDDFVTRSGYVITPFVVVHEHGRGTLTPGPGEVDDIYRIPIDGSHVLYEHGPHELSEGNMQCSIHDLDLFAPTGAIVYQFLELWNTGEVPDVTQFREPAFSSR